MSDLMEHHLHLHPHSHRPMFLSGDKACGDDKQLYKDVQVLRRAGKQGGHEHRAVRSLPLSRLSSLRCPVGTQCRASCLPVFRQCQSPVNKDLYLAAYPNKDNCLNTFMWMDIWTFNAFAFNAGKKLMIGTSYLKYALDGSKFGPANVSSVPRNLFVHEYFLWLSGRCCRPEC